MHKKHNNDPFEIIKRALQWSHYQGGLPLVFVMFGIVLVGLFAILSYWFGYNWVVLAIGVSAILLGLFLENLDDRNNK